MALEVTGKLTKFLTPQTGEKKDGSGNWIKQSFLVETDSQYNNLYCFEVFGDEKVTNLTKYQKEGDSVTVEFNVNTNEYKGSYYTTLAAWKISKFGATIEQREEKSQTGFAPSEEDHDDLPFN
jgi:hypothetical protein